MDSVHVKSNMKQLGRMRLVGRTTQAFLRNLRRKGVEWYEQVKEEVRQKYAEKKGGGEIFSRVKPSEAKETLVEACQDLCDLVEQFREVAEIERMQSYQVMKRVLGEQCKWEERDVEKRVEVKAGKEVGVDSVQNPSDVEAGYNGHKGQGYTMQMMETYHGEETTSPRLITYVAVTSAAITDHHAVEPALEEVQKRGVGPKILLADTLYGSDENVQKAMKKEVELIAPIANKDKVGELSLSSFELDEEGMVKRCPWGQVPIRVQVQEKGVTAWFELRQCAECPYQGKCPGKRSRKKVRLYYDKVAMRSCLRRQAESGEEFREKYRMRSGIESSFSELDRRTGVKHLRVRGLKAVRFCVFLKALGLNIMRFAAWIAGGGKEFAPEPGKGFSSQLVGVGKTAFANFFGQNWRLASFSNRIPFEKFLTCALAAALLSVVINYHFFEM